jgi:hypothetical protein
LVLQKGRSPIAERAPSQRSKVTNGKSHFIEADSRGPWARRFKDLVELHVADIGGIEGLSEVQKQLVRRVATIETELERMEGQLAEGAEVDLAKYATVSNTYRRLAETLGLRRVAKDVTPTLAELVARQGK